MATGGSGHLLPDEERLMRRRPAVDPEVAESWYADVQGVIYGPLAAAELLDKVRAGEVTSETLVKKGDSQWVPAGEVTGLFEAAFRAATYYKCPYCGAQVDKPPTVCLGCDREITAVYRVRERPATPAKTAPPPAKNPQDVPTSGPEHSQPSARDRPGTVVHALVRWFRSWVSR